MLAGNILACRIYLLKPARLGALPVKLELGLLPTFDADPSSGLARLVAHAASKTTPPRTTPATTKGEYSATTSLPQKLVARIQNLEFVEMGELLPESWIPEPQDASSTSRQPALYAPVCAHGSSFGRKAPQQSTTNPGVPEAHCTCCQEFLWHLLGGL